MHDFALTRLVDGFFLVIHLNEKWPVPIANPREECGQSVIVVLRPAFAGVIVAASAADAYTQEQLGHFLGPRLGIAQPTIETRGRMAVIAAAPRHDRASQLVVGHVGEHGLANPLVIEMRTDLADETLIATEPIRPLERPPVGELRTLQQLINHTLAFAGILVGEKAAHLVGSG